MSLFLFWAVECKTILEKQVWKKGHECLCGSEVQNCETQGEGSFRCISNRKGEDVSVFASLLCKQYQPEDVSSVVSSQILSNLHSSAALLTRSQWVETVKYKTLAQGAANAELDADHVILPMRFAGWGNESSVRGGAGIPGWACNCCATVFFFPSSGSRYVCGWCGRTRCEIGLVEGTVFSLKKVEDKWELSSKSDVYLFTLGGCRRPWSSEEGDISRFHK